MNYYKIVLSVLAFVFCALLFGCAVSSIFTSGTRPEPAVKAPVYKDGDWWVFRIKIVRRGVIGRHSGEHRVDYKNGRFENDSGFLTGADNPPEPIVRPFASVYLKDPQRKWLDFPLVPGKKWSYRYRAQNRAGRAKWRWAAAEVIGTVPQPMEIPDGKFKVIEIQRHDTTRTGLKLTYFYSPETKSVVKLTGHTTQGEPRFELELIKYSVRK